MTSKILPVLAIVGALALTGCASGESPEQAAPSPTETVREISASTDVASLEDAVTWATSLELKDASSRSDVSVRAMTLVDWARKDLENKLTTAEMSDVRIRGMRISMDVLDLPTEGEITPGLVAANEDLHDLAVELGRK
ncbi:hypothetical protein [Mycetocola saprophilus]|uniref:hypothetical protein n=1 Tax=Mycetocola saprophilus TaxID=76636 RepID=UPI0012DC52CC|nr:hypothetical protein [Mycetocola saprophilus]